MKRRIVGCGIICGLCFGLLTGCGTGMSDTSQIDKDREDGEEQCVIYSDAEDKEDYVKEMLQIEIDEDVLAVYVGGEYGEKEVSELNSLLKEQGYDFQVQFRQIPDGFLVDGGMEELASYMKEQGVQADVLPFWREDMADIVEKELAADITERIGQEGTEQIMQSLPERFWTVTAVDGKNYGIGNMYAPAPDGWAVNKELMEKYGFSYDDLAKPLWEMEDVFETVSKGEAGTEGFAAFSFVPGYLYYYIPFYFPDESLPVGFWTEDSGGSLIVSDLFETEQMKELAGVLNDYDEKGYLRSSGIQSEEENFFMQADYNGFPVFRQDYLDTWTNGHDIELTRIRYYEPTEGDLLIQLNAIPSWSEHEEEAFRFLCFIFSNQEASDLLLYGTGEEEQDTDETIYQKKLGNALISSIAEPYEDESKAEVNRTVLDNMTENPLYGFRFDESAVQKQADAMREIFGELSSQNALFMYDSFGNTDSTWEENYEDYIDQLKAAGIDDVVDEMNRQIQEYMK